MEKRKKKIENEKKEKFEKPLKIENIMFFYIY